MAWQPFFVAYANSQGMTPETVIERDRQQHRGGSMAGYLRWIAAHWHEFGIPVGSHTVTADDVDQFTRWLNAKYPAVTS